MESSSSFTSSKRIFFLPCCWSLLLLVAALIVAVPSVGALSITTFNVLAAVHRTHPQEKDRRESERRDWWQPRAEGLAQFVAKELSFSDVILLQEWWFGPDFQEIFDCHTGDLFDRVAEQRPGPGVDTLREDGMAVLVKKGERGGKLELLSSTKIRTGPQRIAQIVQCQERTAERRKVLLGNAHLSFPGGQDAVANERRQAYEVQLLARYMSREGRRLSSQDDSGTVLQGRGGGHMQVLAGDFNSNSRALASTVLESDRHHFVNCMSAHAEQNLNSIGGPVNTGVTHRTHLGQLVSVDQIFARLMKDDGTVSKTSLRRLGGPPGTYVLDCRKRHLQIEGETILSDHMPVTATLHWPTTRTHQETERNDGLDVFMDHPLHSPWGS